MWIEILGAGSGLVLAAIVGLRAVERRMGVPLNREAFPRPLEPSARVRLLPHLARARDESLTQEGEVCGQGYRAVAVRKPARRGWEGNVVEFTWEACDVTGEPLHIIYTVAWDHGETSREVWSDLCR